MSEKPDKTAVIPDPIESFNKAVSKKAIESIDKNFLVDRQNLAGKRLMKLLPFQIFLLIADADGKTDKKEVNQFKGFLNQREKHCTNPYTRRMFHSTVINYSSLLNRYLSGQIERDMKLVKKAMAYISLCASQKIVLAICHDLRELAKSIAEASGGFIGMTSPVSQEEKTVIDELDQIFQLAVANAQGKENPQKGWMDI